MSVGDGPAANGTPARRAQPLRADRHDNGSLKDLQEMILRVENIDFSYGPLQILFDVTVEIPRGSSVALVGTNGAGKSTVLKIASGLLTPDRGTVTFGGNDVTKLSAERRAADGMTLIEGGKAIFPSLTVLDNLRLGGYPFFSNRQLLAERLEEALSVFPNLRARVRQPAGTLSGGEQQMVAIGRAMIAGAQLLIIDELSLGLAPVVLEQLVEVIDRFRADGRTLLLVEQSLNVSMALADHTYFMEKGEVLYSGPTSDLLARGDLARSVFFGDRGPSR
jgi:ABC-type branched-subunit amino acid transport system ATPase component